MQCILMLTPEDVTCSICSFLDPLALLRMCSVSQRFKWRFSGPQGEDVFAAALTETFAPFVRIQWGKEGGRGARGLYRAVWYNLLKSVGTWNFLRYHRIDLGVQLFASHSIENHNPFRALLLSCPSCCEHKALMNEYLPPSNYYKDIFFLLRSPDKTDRPLTLELDGHPFDAKHGSRKFGTVTGTCKTCRFQIKLQFDRPLKCEDHLCTEDATSPALARCLTCENFICHACRSKKCERPSCVQDEEHWTGHCSDCTGHFEYCDMCERQLCRYHRVVRVEFGTQMCDDCFSFRTSI